MLLTDWFKLAKLKKGKLVNNIKEEEEVDGIDEDSTGNGIGKELVLSGSSARTMASLKEEEGARIGVLRDLAIAKLVVIIAILS